MEEREISLMSQASIATEKRVCIILDIWGKIIICYSFYK
jgi:hypothetical protein